MLREVIDRLLDCMSCLELLELCNQELVLEGIRMVVVELRALLEGHIVMGTVVGVLGDDRDLVAEALGDGVRDCRLARTCAACHADNGDVCHMCPQPLHVLCIPVHDSRPRGCRTEKARRRCSWPDSCLRMLMGYRSFESSSTSFENSSSAASTASPDAMSTPAPRRSSIGLFEQPPERKAR